MLYVLCCDRMIGCEIKTFLVYTIKGYSSKLYPFVCYISFIVFSATAFSASVMPYLANN